MGHRLPEVITTLRDQPVEFVDEVCGLTFRATLLVNVGDTVPQHVHDYEHATVIAAGKARLWIDGMHKGDYAAFQVIAIEANREHVFQALEPMTRLACVHQTSLAEYRVARKNRFGG